MRLWSIILAAGRGERIGGPKALLTVGGESFVARSARLLARPGIERVVAVIGHEADRVARGAGLPSDLTVIVNGRYGEGMLTSIHAGLDAAEAAGAEGVLIHPVDHPLVDVAAADRVIGALQAGAIIAVPSHDGRRGHPAGFARAAWPALHSAPAGRGARAVLADHPDWVIHVEGDADCLQGVNTPEDYRRLLARPFG
jgi:molybdenum cofactor cytidylyltransferase